ncbi:MAG: hypothetical protein GX808_14365 [Syntrophomonadaceae bacterium]|jgi:hypothetical protein|nr:hypothetical protein [Syntrophomonadaceae bacterium]
MITKMQQDLTDKACRILPVCSICQQVPDKGIRDGIMIKKVFICCSCEIRIVNLSVDSVNYNEVINRIKAIGIML